MRDRRQYGRGTVVKVKVEVEEEEKIEEIIHSEDV
jgi:hypothetical protein